MKKRILMFLLATLLVFSIVGVAMAEDDDVCLHENGSWTDVEWDDYEKLTYAQKDKAKHLVTGAGFYYVYCNDCGALLDEGYSENCELEQWHEFDEDSVCTLCGYACKHVNSWTSTSFDWDKATYTSVDDKYHEVIGPGYTYTYCEDCGRQFNEVAVDELKETYWHDYDENGVCYNCQHKNACEHQHLSYGFSWGDDVSFLPLDDTYHQVKGTGYVITFCDDCGQTIDVADEVSEKIDTEWHQYDPSGVCYQCGHQNTCEHENTFTYFSWTNYADVTFVSKDDKYHTVTGKGHMIKSCEDCGEILDRGEEETRSEDEWHEYDEDGVCIRCKHKNACKHENTYHDSWWDDYSSCTFTEVDDRYHEVSGPGYSYTRCEDCGLEMDREDIPELVKRENHEYNSDGICIQCGHETHCEHLNTWEGWTFSDWDDVKYAKKDGKTHTATGLGYTYTYCQDCGQRLDRSELTTLTEELSHEYDDKNVCRQCGYKNTCKHPNAYQEQYFFDWDTVETTYTATTHTYSGGAGVTYMYCPDCGKSWDEKEVEHLTYSEAHHFRAGARYDDETEPVIADVDENYHSFTYSPGEEGIYCSYCGYEKGEWVKKDKVVIKRVHTYDSDGVCTVCGHKKTTGKVTITTQPTSAYVMNGKKATFTVKASGKKLTYQWYSRVNSQGTWKAIKGATKAKYSVTAKPGIDGYQYRCIVKGTGGKATTTFATLTVESHPPAILSQPASVEVNSGEKATFSVEVDGTGLTYQWSYRKKASGSWTTIKKATKASYSLTAKYANNGYQYRCIIKNADGKATTQIATLTVIPQPPVITSGPSDQTVKITEKAVFSVEATGAASYQWYYRTSETAKWTKISKATKASYTVTPSVKNNGYQYYCLVKNEDGKQKSGVATLTLDAVIPVIMTQPKKVTAKKSATVTFTVEAENAESFQWYYRKSSSAKWTKISGATEATYSFKATAKKNGYQYKCDVTSVDAITVASKAVALKVK